MPYHINEESEIIAAWLGFSGMGLALVLFLVPILTFKTIIKSRSTLEFDGSPYIFSLLNCGLWVIYATPSVTPNRMQPLIINSIGLVMEFMYCVIFTIYSTEREFKKKLGVALLFLFGIFVVVFVFFADDTSAASPYLGWLGSGLNIAMYGSPLSVMRQVWYSQSVEYMPLHLSLATFFCSFMWFLYGVFINDLPISFCNICGVLLGICQLCLYHRVSKYPNLSLIDMDKLKGRRGNGEINGYKSLPGMDDTLEEEPDLNTVGSGNPYEKDAMDDFDAI